MKSSSRSMDTVQSQIAAVLDLNAVTSLTVLDLRHGAVDETAKFLHMYVIFKGNFSSSPKLTDTRYVLVAEVLEKRQESCRIF